MVMATVALLKEKPQPTDAEILSWLNTNLCRCCGYVNIVNAVRRAARGLKEGGERHADR
jgi:aerobic-type carbon monoxide dehydrogenase small subunit (CoxS/CutS family)